MIKINNFLDKPLNKFILWFLTGLFILLIGIFPVKADTLYNNNGIKFYNNNGSSVNAVTTSYVEQINESSANLTTIAGSYGGLAVIQLSTPLISGHIYTVFINVGAESNGGETRISAKNCIGIGAWAQQAADNYVTSCVSPKFSNYAPTTSDKGRGVYYTFISNSNNTYLAIPYTSAYSCYDCRNYSYGYIINDGGDTNGLTEQQITNIINNQTSTINNSIQSLTSSIETSITENFENCGQNTVKFSSRIKGKFYSGSSGETSSNSNYNISQFIDIVGGTSYTVDFNDITGLEYGYMCWYNNDTVLSCSQYRQMSGYAATGFVVSAPSSANKVSFTYRKGATSQISGNICVNRLDSTTNAVNDLNDTLNDDDVDSSNATNTLTNLSNSVASNSVISDLLLLPVRLFQNIINSINGTCSPFNLGTLYNTNLSLPCINIPSLIGNTLWTVIDILFCGSFILVIRKKFVDIFESLSELKNGGNEVE